MPKRYQKQKQSSVAPLTPLASLAPLAPLAALTPSCSITSATSGDADPTNKKPRMRSDINLTMTHPMPRKSKDEIVLYKSTLHSADNATIQVKDARAKATVRLTQLQRRNSPSLLNKPHV
jgi:hypothetical protein